MTADLSVPAPQPNPSTGLDLDEIEADFADPGVVGLRKLGTVGTGPLCRLVAAVPALVAEVRRLRKENAELRRGVGLSLGEPTWGQLREKVAAQAEAIRVAGDLADHYKAQRDATGDFLAASRAEAARVREALQAVRELHHRIVLHDWCNHADRDACSAFETVDGDWVCGEPVGDACAECEEDGEHVVTYPCPTVRALDAALDGETNAQ